ncbi:MAG: DUF2067 family protein, partial [Desulfurococcaceae archaeon]
MPFVKRRFHVKCREDECIKLYELLKDKIPVTEYMEFVITNNGLTIEVYGYDSVIKRMWLSIKDLIKLSKIIVPMRGLYRFNIEQLQKITGKTVSLRILVEVLKRTSHFIDYDRETGEIITDIPLQEILDLIIQIDEYAKRIPDSLKGKTTRYYVIVCGVITGLQPEDIIERSKELGIMVNKDSLWRVNIEWR